MSTVKSVKTYRYHSFTDSSHPRYVRQFNPVGSFLDLNRQYALPSYFGYNPYLSSFSGAHSASAAQAGSAGSVSGQSSGAQAQASAQSTSGLNSYNQGLDNYNQGLNNYNQGLNNYNQGLGGYNSGFGGVVPVAPVAPVAPVSTGFQNGASQTDSYTNSQSHSNQNSQK